jgi:putative hydrolase of the HAD superfamily
MSRFRTVVFDLDDTLLDTSALLIPLAARQACEAMIEAGLECSLDVCLTLRAQLAAQNSHVDIFSEIAKQQGPMQKQSQIVAEALNKFYNPPIPSYLPLMPGAERNLQDLKERYNLYLVTMGTPAAQDQKIKALQIASYFKKVYVLETLKRERKISAFQDILAREEHGASEFLSVGNRLSSEIRDAKKLGGWTCFFAHGEHLGEKPEAPEDTPDFTITHHRELIEKCGL